MKCRYFERLIVQQKMHSPRKRWSQCSGKQKKHSITKKNKGWCCEGRNENTEVSDMVWLKWRPHYVNHSIFYIRWRHDQQLVADFTVGRSLYVFSFVTVSLWHYVSNAAIINYVIVEQLALSTQKLEPSVHEHKSSCLPWAVAIFHNWCYSYFFLDRT